MDRDFYRGLYETEWGRRDQLAGSVSTPLTILTILGAAIGWSYQNAALPKSLLGWFPYVGLGLALCAFVLAVYFMARSYHGYTYRQIPTAAQIHSFQTGLAAWDTDTATPGQAEVQFDLQLTERYVEAADRNRKNNDVRSDYVYRANAAILTCVIFVALATIPIILELKQRPDTVHKVEITKIPEE